MTVPQSTENGADKWIARTLRFGVWTSAALMALGLLTQAWQRGTAVNPNTGFAFSDIIQWPPTARALLYAGLLCLMLTPLLRVVTALASFVIQKDWKFAAVSSLVLCMLLVELIMAFL